MKNFDNMNLESLSNENLENINGGCGTCFELGRAIVNAILALL